MNLGLTLCMYDFDGTIVDTSEALFGAYKIAFKSACNIELDRTMWSGLFGKDISQMCERLGVPDKQKEVYEIKKNIYIKEFIPDTKLIKFTRNFYTKPDSFNIICTSTTKDVVESICKYHNVWGYFDEIFDKNDVEYLKPDPEVYIKAMMEYELVVSGKTLVFEDSNTGIEAAKSFKRLFPDTMIYKVEGDSGYPII